MGVQVAGTDLTGLGIPEIIERRRKQAELMHAGNLALNQTPSQVAAQVAASQATQQGNYQAPTMTQQQMVEEAIKTGGTVNPHEATQAVYVPPPPAPPVSGPHGDGRDEGPSDMQQRFERSGADANRGFTRTDYGKAYQRGGLVGIDY